MSKFLHIFVWICKYFDLLMRFARQLHEDCIMPFAICMLVCILLILIQTIFHLSHAILLIWNLKFKMNILIEYFFVVKPQFGMEFEFIFI